VPPKFLADVLDVDVNGFRSNAHFLRDLGVAHTVPYPIENLILTRGEFFLFIVLPVIVGKLLRS
jgi:hypothetical protein